MFSSRLSSAYNSLRGDLGAPQTATDTISKLVERIQTSAAVEDRRTAVLGLKGLSRDWKEDVGQTAFPSLLAVLQHDAPHDVESAKAVLESFMQLCEIPEKPTKDDIGFRHIDAFLTEPTPFHSLLALIQNSTSFYPRFYSLQFLSQLLTARPAQSQAYIMSAPPPGVEAILSTLNAPAPTASAGMGGGATEMLRNEALLLLPVMLAGNADLQKIVAFSGAFERLIEIVDSEGGIDGGIVVQDALTAVGSLLRFNVSNQNYFRELELIKSIPPILGFPHQLAPDEISPDAYCLQYWPEQKVLNTGLILGLVRMLTGGPGGPNQSAMVSSNVTRALLELALSSNASIGIKSQTLNTLTPILLSSSPNQTLMSSLSVAPLVPIQADEANPNGGFIREASLPASMALIQAVIEGDAATGGRGLRGRAAGVNMFEAYVNENDDARIDILSTLASHEPTAGATILSGLLDLPPAVDPYRPLFASLLLAHLVRSSEHAKKLARETTVGEDEDKVSLVQLIVGNLMVAAREQTECANRIAKEGKLVGSSEEEDWTRVMVGYLALLCTWLWDSPKTVREFLSESANLQVLIQPITQATGVDPLVQGLCAFLLGVCYEFNREPGEITRATLHPILHSRIGPDQFVSRMARLREDPRFKAVQPDAFEADGGDVPLDEPDADADEGLEMWFDWAFVDFWKNHYYTIQRSIAIEPDAVRGTGPVDDGETASIIMSLRAKLKTQTEEVMQLQAKLSKIELDHHKEKETLANEVQALSEQIATLSASVTSNQEKIDEQTQQLASQSAELEAEKAKHASTAGLQTRLDSTLRDFDTLKQQLDSTRSLLEQTQASLKEAETRAEEAEGETHRQFVRAQAAEADAAAAAARSASGSGGKKKGRATQEDAKDQEALAAANTKAEQAAKEVEEQKQKVNELEAQLKELKDAASASAESTAESSANVSEKEAEIASLKEQLEAEKKRADAAAAAAEAAKAVPAPTAAPAEEDTGATAGMSGKAAKKAAKAAEKQLEEEKKRADELENELDEVRKKKEEGEKEHEDLLVLLEELSEKRRKDKQRLKEKGEEVSESEGEDD